MLLLSRAERAGLGDRVVVAAAELVRRRLTVFIVWYSTPGVVGSSRFRIAEWGPLVVGLTVTATAPTLFGSAMMPAELNVPSLPTQLRL